MRYFILFIAVVVANNLFAQDITSKSYVSINAGGGLHGLTYDLPEGSSRDIKFNFSTNASYHYSINKSWSIGTGINFSKYSTTFKLGSYGYSYDAVDIDNDPYKMNIAVNGLKEKQSATFLEIPITARYHFPLNSKLDLWVGAGFSIGFLTSAKYEVESGSITTTDYYEQYDWTIKDYPSKGFYATNISGESTDLSLKTPFSVLGEVGIRFSLTQNRFLSANLYGSYCLNDINDEKSMESKLIKLENNHIYYNGLIASGLADNIKLFSLGLKLGVGFSF
ncbi:MAG: PorT family protein [Prevotellaceae bacterium]|jgi:hypothetical protein|nr:PorT family protein [Prevotellaceae bacterium]